MPDAQRGLRVLIVGTKPKYPEKGIFHGPLAYQATGRQYLKSHCSDITRHCHLIERSALQKVFFMDLSHIKQPADNT